MTYRNLILTGAMFLFLAGIGMNAAQAQQTVATSTNATVPTLVSFSGVLTGSNGKPLTSITGVIFALYAEQQGGAPLWLETQNVQPDKAGNYSVMLGSTTSQGLPASLFASGQARWLGVQPQGQEEQPRVLLLSVPYALKALDAETIGGKPASSFMLAPAAGNGGASPNSQATNITGSGTADYLPVFTGTTTIGNSKVYQNSSGDIGIGTTSPAATLDANGKTDVRDTLTLYPKGSDNTLAINGTAFKINSTGNVSFVSGQTFPGTGTVTSVGSGAGLTGGPITKSGTLSIATGGVTNAMLANSSLTVNPGGGMTGGGKISLGGSATLGLENCSANQVLEFVSGAWTCTNAGTGTITGVTAGTDLTGGGSSGNVTLNVDTTKVPQLAAANTFTNNNVISVNSTEPALAVSNTSKTTDAMYVSSPNETAIVVDGYNGISATASGALGDGGAFYSKGTAGVGVYGNGVGIGVQGENDSNTDYLPGVYGYESGSSAFTFGVWGFVDSPSGAGVYGESIKNSSLQSGEPPMAGVWGDTGQTGNIAVLGTADDAYGAMIENDSPSGYDTLRVVGYDGTDSSALLLNAFSNAFGGSCTIDVNGNLKCSGSITGVIKLEDGSRKVALNAIQSPENWFEDFGSGQLSNGAAVVSLEPTFAQTVNTGVEYHVFLTPKGDSHGLYVTNETATSFEVREQGGGTSSIAFDYRIVAKRKGFENVRLETETKLEPHIQRPSNTGHHPPSPEELRHEHNAAARRVAQLTDSPIKKQN